MRKKEVEVTLNPSQFNRLDKLIRKVLFSPRFRVKQRNKNQKITTHF